MFQAVHGRNELNAWQPSKISQCPITILPCSCSRRNPRYFWNRYLHKMRSPWDQFIFYCSNYTRHQFLSIHASSSSWFYSLNWTICKSTMTFSYLSWSQGGRPLCALLNSQWAAHNRPTTVMICLHTTSSVYWSILQGCPIHFRQIHTRKTHVAIDATHVICKWENFYAVISPEIAHCIFSFYKNCKRKLEQQKAQWI